MLSDAGSVASLHEAIEAAQTQHESESGRTMAKLNFQSAVHHSRSNHLHAALEAEAAESQSQLHRVRLTDSESQSQSQSVKVSQSNRTVAEP